MDINLTVAAEKEARVIEAFKGLYEIPQVADPAYEGDGEAPLVPQYTDAQWPREVLCRILCNTVARYEQVKAQRAVPFVVDTTLVM